MPGSAQQKPKMTLTMQAIYSDHYTLQLIIHRLSREFAELLGCAEPDAVCGQSAAVLFAQDSRLLDEWKEFLLRLKYAPQRISMAAAQQPFCWQSLQFLHCCKCWLQVTLCCRLEENLVEVEFVPAGEAAVSPESHYYYGLKQSLWLESTLCRSGYWECDLSSQTILVARTLANDLHLGDDTLLLPLDELYQRIHAEDLPKIEKVLRTVERKPKPLKIRIRLPGGELAHLQTIAVPGYDMQGRLAYICGQAQNITAQEQAAAELMLSEQRFLGIIENSQDLFVVVGQDGCISYVSQNIQEILGYTPEEVLGQDFRNYIAKPEERAHLSTEYQAILDGANFSGLGQYQIRHADGRTRLFLVTVSTMRDHAAKTIESIVMCRDITEESLREQNLRYMSIHDTLTGTYNRFYFEQEMERLQRESVMDFGLIITDINGLKLVNDAHGHQHGDLLLIRAAELLRALDWRQKRYDMFRVGGDEFAFFVYDCSYEELEQICEKIDGACHTITAGEVPLHISWGAAHRTNINQSMQSLFKQAEGRMNNKKLLENRSTRNQLLASLKETLKMRNVETSDHMQRMENMVMALGKRLGLPANDFNRLVLLASMHDVGKVAIPDHIINKPGPLTEEEWKIMHTHSEAGSRIAMSSQELSSIAKEIGCHHEHYNGKGYPNQYSGSHIPLLSRIISVVDAYDVMTHKRVYKESVSHREALNELQRCAGSQFDPRIVALFLEIFGNLTQAEMRSFTGADPKLQLLGLANAENGVETNKVEIK